MQRDQYRTFCEQRARDCIAALKADLDPNRREKVIHLAVAWLDLAKQCAELTLSGAKAR